VPAVNYGPADPSLSHTDEEHCPAAAIRACERALTDWLRSPALEAERTATVRPV
jgi:succinyl-diaminopimelate desuccinylase